MSKDLQHIKEIEEYLSGDLTPEMRNEFEKRLKEDPDLQADLSATTNLIEGIQGYAFKQMLRDFHNKHFGDNSNT